MTKLESPQVPIDRRRPFWWPSWLSDKAHFDLEREFDKSKQSGNKRLW